MSRQPPLAPLRFSPDLAQPTPEEAEINGKIDHQMGKIRQKTYEDSGHAIRSVHAKSHGILQAELQIDAELPEVLAQGIFAQPGRHDVLMRFSTIPGDILPDSVSTPRGVAIKIFNVEGERLPGSEASTNQDFILVNSPTFQAPDAKAFLSSLKPIVATTDRVEGWKKVVSAAARGIETVVEAVGGESAKLKAMGGQLETHILGDSFFSQLPVRFGDYVAKISIAPFSDNLRALTDQSLNVNGVPDGIREAGSTSSGTKRPYGSSAPSFAQISKTCRSSLPTRDGAKTKAPISAWARSLRSRSKLGAKRGRKLLTMEWASTPGTACKRTSPWDP